MLKGGEQEGNEGEDLGSRLGGRKVNGVGDFAAEASAIEGFRRHVVYGLTICLSTSIPVNFTED
jgi:hypothetical protein